MNDSKQKIYCYKYIFIIFIKFINIKLIKNFKKT